MGRRFRFFDWARGKSGDTFRDLRRLVILLIGVVVAVVVIVIVRRIHWDESGNDEHPHEKGPRGGFVVAITKEEPHYHAEVLVEDNGRIHLFLYGKETDQVAQVSPQLLIGNAQGKGEVESTSVILRPAGDPAETTKKTSHFVGRLPPEWMGRRLIVSVNRLEIGDRDYAFQFELSERLGGARQAAESERALVFEAHGKYTKADVEAAGKAPPSEKFKAIKVSHMSRTQRGDVVCPVTRAKADPRITWQVDGNNYQFCCGPCIAEFVGWAREYPERIVPPEDLVKKN